METKKLNLTKILKDCPEGTKLYSPFLGVVLFHCLFEHDGSIEVTNVEGNTYQFSPDGKYIDNKDGEVSLFPSKENRDWSTFVVPKAKIEHFDPKTLKPFDKVLVRMFDKVVWLPAFFAYVDEDDSIVTTHDSFYVQCIPYNDDTKHLAGTGDNAPDYYKYWED